MSRCFPYLRPGYVGTGASREALIEPIKPQRETEKGKTERKEERRKGKEERREKKERKREKREKREKEREERKTNKNSDVDVSTHKRLKVCVDAQRDGKRGVDGVEQLEKSDLTEEHGPAVGSHKPSYSSDSTQNSNKRKRDDSPTPSGTSGHGNVIKIRLSKKRKEPKPSQPPTLQVPLHKDKAPVSLQKLKEPISVSRQAEAGSVRMQPDLISVHRKPGSIPVQRKLETTSVQRIPESTSVQRRQGSFSVEREPESFSVHRQPESIPASRQPESISGPRQPESLSVRRPDEHAPLQKHKESLVGLPKQKEKLLSDLVSQKPRGPVSGLTLQRHKDINLGEETICSTSGNAVVFPPLVSESVERLPTTGDKRQICSTSGASEIPVPVHTHVSSHGRKLQKKDEKYGSLIASWIPPLLQAHLPDDDDQDWLFGKRQRDDDRIEGKRYIPSEDISSSCCGRSSLWPPRAQYLPEADVYALPYTIPF